METPAHTTHAWRFGVYEVDAQGEELRREGHLIELREQSFRILLELLEHAGQLVTREDLRKSLWPADICVDFDHSLNTAVMNLRRALGDTADKPLYVETVPKRGYRFVAPVSAMDQTVDDGTAGIHGPHPEPTSPGSAFPAQSDPQAETTAARPSRTQWVWWSVGLACLGIIVAALFLLARFGKLNQGAPKEPSPTEFAASQIKSIAVLPLENLSGDVQQEYFADGLTENLISDLGQVARLHVISRGSVSGYKESTKPLAQIAQELNVDAVVEGTVQRSGDRVQITVQLLDAKSDRRLWGQSYGREAGDVLGLEKSVALAIAHEINGRLNAGAQPRLRNAHPVKEEAYDDYLRGRHLLDQRTPEAESDARGFFERAIRTDPQFALAYTGLADYFSCGWSGPGDLATAEKYARRALEIDPDLAEGHASLGIIAIGQRRFGEGEKELKKAIELNPSYAMAHQWNAIYLQVKGLSREALAENEQARELDPFSFPINYIRGAILFDVREDERAIEQLEMCASISPQSSAPAEEITRIYWLEGKVREALATERAVANKVHDEMLLHNAEETARVYQRAGVRAAQLRMAQLREQGYELEHRAGVQPAHGLHDPFMIAVQFAAAGDKERSLHWLGEAANESGLTIFIGDVMGAPEFKSLHSDARFQALVRGAGIMD